MAGIQHVDTLIIGAGLSGLITALKLNEINPNSDLAVLDKSTFPVKDLQPIVLDPVSRNLLHSFKEYKSFNFNEGRYKIFNLVNYQEGIRIKSEDTAILPYSNLTYTLYSIAVLNNIPIHLKSEVTTIAYQDKYICTKGGQKIEFSNVVDATGVHAKAKLYSIDWSSPIIDEDQNEYNICIGAKPSKIGIKVLQPVTSNSPTEIKDHIAVGDAGGYVDFFTYCNANLAIISGITAGEVIANNLSIEEYYKRMNIFRNHIMGSIAMRNNIPKESEEFNKDLADVLLHGDKTYKELYDKYVRAQ